MADVSLATAPNTNAVADPQVAPSVVRGVCAGCGLNVMSGDEDRVREDDHYFHRHCVKGQCGGCGKVVHANAERNAVRGVYWHLDCSLAQSSSSRVRR